jgi:hypothetical protein
MILTYFVKSAKLKGNMKVIEAQFLISSPTPPLGV